MFVFFSVLAFYVFLLLQKKKKKPKKQCVCARVPGCACVYMCMCVLVYMHACAVCVHLCVHTRMCVNSSLSQDSAQGRFHLVILQIGAFEKYRVDWGGERPF